MRCSSMEWSDTFRPDPKKHWVALKEDGQRMMLFYDNGVKRFISERNIDGKEKYPEIAENLKLKHSIKEVILDGELVCYVNGKSEFNKILNRNTNNKFKIKMLRKQGLELTFVVFDILSLNYASLRHYPLSQRKKYLVNAIEENDYIKIAKDWSNNYEGLINKIKSENQEGLIIKNKNSIYIGGKRIWTKMKFKKEIILKMTDYEIHKDNNGVTYHDQENFNRVSVNGQGSKKGIDDIKKHGYCLVETQYLRKNPSNKLFQPAWKRFGEIK